MESEWTNKRVTLVVLMAIYAVVILCMILRELERLRRFQEAAVFARSLERALDQAPRSRRGRK